MSFNPWTSSHFKADQPSRFERKQQQKAVTDAAWRACCKAVDARDHGRCRVCGRRCNPDAVAMLQRGERHHITYRSAGGDDDSANVVLICGGCHADVHAHRLEIRGDADTGIEVWRVEAGCRDWFMVFRELAPHRRERD